MPNTREDIVTHIIEKVLKIHGVMPYVNSESAASIEDAKKSIFEIFGKTQEIEDEED